MFQSEDQENSKSNFSISFGYCQIIHQLVVPEFSQLGPQSEVRGHQEIGPVFMKLIIIH